MTLVRCYSDSYPITCYYLQLEQQKNLTGAWAEDWTGDWTEAWAGDIDSETHLLLRRILGLGTEISPVQLRRIRELHDAGYYIEIGPRLNFQTPWSSAVLAVFQRLQDSLDIKVLEIEKSCLYPGYMSIRQISWDTMTQMKYPRPLESLMKGGEGGEARVAREEIQEPFRVWKEDWEAFSASEGLGLDAFQLELYQSLGRNELTDVELYDLAQSNSEHSRHWLFRGRMRFFDGTVLQKSLMDLIKEPLAQLSQRRGAAENSLIAMCDNSSAIRGFGIDYLSTGEMGSKYRREKGKLLHPILTAETHNFPTGIAPFPGAATGVGGRIRDIQAIGRGGLMGAGTVGYCVGRLQNKDGSWCQASTTGRPGGPGRPSPVEILIQASNGASDYGNKIGEPQIVGFCRSFGMNLVSESHLERRIEWSKPIMFSGGIGGIFQEHLEKKNPEQGLLIVRLGGPTFRIGIGGGAASSRPQGSGLLDTDTSAVQRGDPEMENRLNRVIRACIELGTQNPILSIHDQGAGGMGNVTKEIVAPMGGIVSLSNVITGDHTLSARELWIAESQEQNTILIHPRNIEILKTICQRENLPCAFVGFVTDDGRMQVCGGGGGRGRGRGRSRSDGGGGGGGYDTEELIVDLPLNKILDDVPPKTFHVDTSRTNWIRKNKTGLQHKLGKIFFKHAYVSMQGRERRSMNTIESLRQQVFWTQLQKVFSLVSVGSKRFLTNKVDRSVSGLVAQQQCVGPLATPLANCGVYASSYFNTVGTVTAIGEQPLKGLTSPGRMARLAVGEMLTNMVWAPITAFEDIKISGNWMWEKRESQEIYALLKAVKSLSDCLKDLGLAIDGGKDSLSMSSVRSNPETGEDETVLCPRSLVVSGYCTCPDITGVVTPDLKEVGNLIFFIDLGLGNRRLGGSALAQSLNEIGGEVPDIQDLTILREVFTILQKLIKEGIIVSGHDRSDGGLIGALLEMAIAGNRGLQVDLWGLVQDGGSDITDYLWNEELGLLLEVRPQDADRVMTDLRQVGGKVMGPHPLARVINDKKVVIEYGLKKDNAQDSLILMDRSLSDIRQLWEKCSYELECQQIPPIYARAEKEYLLKGIDPHYVLPINPICAERESENENGYSVAIMREEGSNGDREMAAAFHMAGFEVYDVTTTDLLRKDNPINLLDFNGIAFVGGFSFADVLGAGRAWALTLTEHPKIRKQLEAFRARKDRFSLGICNGAQLLAELGWVPGKFTKNLSGRFESRWSTVSVPEDCASILLRNMQGLRFGIWVAHGEGRYIPPSNEGSGRGIGRGQGCLNYVEGHTGSVTTTYPENPNGSEDGVAAVCSTDGRHLAMMPHPERSVLTWQAPWIDPEIQDQCQSELPWLRIFRNAYEWCESIDRNDDEMIDEVIDEVK